MGWFTKKKKPKAVYYNIAPGDLVELTIVGTWDGREIRTKGNSWFTVSGLQVDPWVWVRSIEEEQGN